VAGLANGPKLPRLLELRLRRFGAQEDPGVEIRRARPAAFRLKPAISAPLQLDGSPGAASREPKLDVHPREAILAWRSDKPFPSVRESI
jgi:hypothetical protein